MKSLWFQRRKRSRDCSSIERLTKVELMPRETSMETKRRQQEPLSSSLIVVCVASSPLLCHSLLSSLSSQLTLHQSIVYSSNSTVKFTLRGIERELNEIRGKVNGKERGENTEKMGMREWAGPSISSCSIKFCCTWRVIWQRKDGRKKERKQ